MTMVDWGNLGKNALSVVSAVPAALIPGARGSLWDQTIGNDPGADQERQRRELLYQQAAASGHFAGRGEKGFADLGQQGNANIAALQRIASGQDSVAAEQLRQGLQQNLAAQQSMAAGASPQNAAMAARTAAIQSARLGAGLSGQQALAGLQERNQAQGQLANAIQGLRGQDLQAALQGRQSAIAGYGGYNTPLTPEKSFIEKYGPAIQSGISAAAMSDRRAKTGIRGGDGAAARALRGLKAYSLGDKDEANGEGPRVGIMAQDL